MKILVVQDHLRSGGTERQSVLLAGGFAAAGHDTSLFTFRPGGVLAPTLDQAVKLRTLQPFDTGLDWFAPGLLAAAGRVRPEVTLCMGRMANCQSGSLQTRLRELHPRAVVVATMRTGKSLPWLFRRSLRQVRHVVANSRAAKQTLVAQHGLAAEKISVIHNSLVFPSESSLVRDESIRARWGATSATTVLLNVAMFRPEKNQRELIETITGLPRDFNFQLWLAGDGPARADCERLVSRRQWGDNVKFVGFQADPTALYAAADLAVHASSSDSLSNFLIEAQAHGLPAVAFAAQGMDECCLPGDTGFIIPRGDHRAFLSALTRLIREPAAGRTSRAARARVFAHESFEPRRQTAAYLDLFRNLCATLTP